MVFADTVFATGIVTPQQILHLGIQRIAAIDFMCELVLFKCEDVGLGGSNLADTIIAKVDRQRQMFLEMEVKAARTIGNIYPCGGTLALDVADDISFNLHHLVTGNEFYQCTVAANEILAWTIDGRLVCSIQL